MIYLHALDIEAVKQLIVAAFKSSRRGTQSRVADALGVRVQTVNKWAQGHIAPEPHRWPALETALGLDDGSIAAAAGIRTGGERGGVTSRLDELEEALRGLAQRIDALERRGGARGSARVGSTRRDDVADPVGG